MASITKITSGLLRQSRAVLAIPQTRAMCVILNETPAKRKPTNLERKALVSAKKFKTKDEIPDTVNISTLDHSRLRYLVKLTSWAVVVGGVLFAAFTFIDRDDRDRGLTVTESGANWHENQKDEPAEKAK